MLHLTHSHHATVGLVALAGALVALIAASPLTTNLWPNSKPTVSTTPLTPDERTSLLLKRRLISQEINLDDVRVHVRQKIAYLGGFAHNRHQKQKAITIAEQTPGVVDVDDQKLRHVVDLPAVLVVANQDTMGMDPSHTVAASTQQSAAWSTTGLAALEPRRTTGRR